MLHVVWSLRPGGLERTLCQVVSATQSCCVDHSVLCLDASGQYREMLPSDVPVCVAASGGNDLAGAAAVRCALKRRPAAVVHAHNWCTWPAAALGTWPSGPRLVWTLHGWDEAGPMPTKRALVCKVLAGMTTALMAVSADTADQFCRQTRVPRRRVEVIGNPVDMDRFANVQRRKRRNGRFVVAGIGRLTAIKDWPTWLEAVRVLNESVPTGVEALLAGDGELRGQLQRQAELMGLGGTIKFLGHQRDITGVLERADAVMLLSRREGLPLVLLEAMAARVPVVASAVGGVPEIVHHEETGLLVPPGRAEPAAAALRRLIDEPELSDSLTRRAWEHVRQHHCLDRIAERYVQLYQRVALGGRLTCTAPAVTGRL